MYDLIIFDCDGTIVDSELIYNTAISEMITECGGRGFTPEYCLDHFTGMTLGDIKRRVEGKDGLDLSAITSERYTARAQGLMEFSIHPVDGAADLLAHCRAQGKICVGSNGERSSVMKSLKLTGLYDYFGNEDHIFTKIQVERPKPAPDLFLFAAQKMEVEPTRCLVIEDSVVGVRAAVAAGMDCIGYSGSTRHKAALEAEMRDLGVRGVYERLQGISEHLSAAQTRRAG